MPGFLVAALVVDSGSGLCRAGIAGFSRAVLLFVVVKPKMPRILAGMAQKDSSLRALVDIPQWHVQGWFYW